MNSLTFSDKEYCRFVRVKTNGVIKAAYSELEWAVEKLQTDIERLQKERFPSLHPRKIWSLLEDKPLDLDAIDALAEDWAIDFSPYVGYGACDEKGKKILIHPKLFGFERDTTVFHELLHAWYEKEIDHRWSAFAYDNEIIIEYLSRKLRNNAELLKHTITSFNLPPHVYDHVSYFAFGRNIDLEKQQEFFFAKDHYDRLRKVQTDII